MKEKGVKTTTTIAIAVIVAIVSATVTYYLVKPEEEAVGKFREVPLEWIMSLEENLATPWTPHGPADEPLQSYEDIALTDEEKVAARALALKEYYFMGATLDVTEILNKIGMDAVLADLGKSPISFMGCESISEQMDQVDTLVAKAADVSFVVAQAYEAVTLGPAFVRLSGAGVLQAHNWTTPSGLFGTPSYIGLIDADGYGQGAAAAEILAYAMDYEGEVGIIYFALEQWTNVMRLAGAENTFAKYSGITVVDRRGFTDPAEGYELATGMLTAHPEIDAIWATWMVGPGTGAGEAVIALGRQGEVVVAAPDLGGLAGARYIADPDHPIIGAGEADCIEMGKNSINAAMKWLIGKEDEVRNGYFVSKVYPFVRANLVDMWYKSGNDLHFGPLPLDVLELLEE